MGSEHAPKQSFGFALAIYIGMIEKVYAAFKCRIDKLDYLGLLPTFQGYLTATLCISCGFLLPSLIIRKVFVKVSHILLPVVAAEEMPSFA